MMLIGINNFWTLGFSGAVEAPNPEITSILVDFKNDQRKDVPIEITATSDSTIDSWKWEVFDSNTRQRIDISLEQNPTFTISITGFYDLKLTAKSSTDTYTQRWDRAWFVDLPRFTEEEADIVINGSSYFNNFASADNTGLKILIKGASWSGSIQLANLQGSAGYENHVRIQVEDSTALTVASAAHAFWLNGDCRYITLDGFDANGDNGLTFIGISGSSGQPFIAKDGGFTDIIIKGVNVTHNNNAFAAGIAFIPVATSTYNATNWVAENISVYRCTTTDTGDEGCYLGYNNDDLQGSYRPYKLRNVVIARNTFTDSGRDAIQAGSSCNLFIHDNIVDGWGMSQDVFHESAISYNSGNYGLVYNNNCLNGKMFLNIQSGNCPWDIEAGQTSPQPSYFFSNVFINGTYPGGGATEPFAIYAQTENGSGSGAYNIHLFHNTLIADKKCMEMYYHPSSFNSTGLTFANNIIVKVGNAGDYAELNFFDSFGIGSTGHLVNNLVREEGAESDILFTNLAGNDVTISSFSSPAYTGASDLDTRLSAISSYLNDHLGYPNKIPSGTPTFGAYSGYEKQEFYTAPADSNPATFTTPVTVTGLNQFGGTLNYNANKIGVLYYIASTLDVQPTISQIRQGKDSTGSPAVFAGTLVDLGTVTPKELTSGSEATNYYLFCVFVTEDNIPQASVTRVPFTTAADTTAPTLSDFRILDANRNRVYFNSSEPITGTTYSSFIVSGKTVTGMTIATGETTGHYFTVNSDFNAMDTPTIQYSGGNNVRDTASTPNSLASFGATSVANNIVPAAAETWVAGSSSNASISSGRASSTGAGGIKTSKYIPASSNGYIQWGFEAASVGAFTDARIGFVLGSTSFTYTPSQLLANSYFLTNTNTDAYQGNTFRDSQGGIQSVSNLYRLTITRSTQNISLLWSTDGGNSWNNLYTFAGIGAGDLYGGICFGVTGKAFPTLTIQADTGLL